jgi:class 3 adenylate cyclase/predicted ATPase
MKCGSCGCATREGQRFCEACGTALEKKCKGCSATAGATARFCGSCGATFPVDGGAAADATPTGTAATSATGLHREADPRHDAGERRQLTVLFADVVGSTTLSGRLDPEALRALLRAYQQVCVECVERYGGHIHQYAGDGVLAYFGYPQAHDRDAERAVLAALDIAQGTRRLSADLRRRGEAEIAVRIGIHTGMVVVGEMGAGKVREVHAIGETPNIAARIQGEAAADAVCVSAATARLLGARFQTRSMGLRPLKGVAREIELFSVDAAIAVAHAEAARPNAPLIGRDKELLHLQERWALARSGQGQAVLISGEGGIGKSSLLAAFRESAGAGAGGPAWRNVFCSPFYQNSALHPLIDLIERGVLRDSGDTPAERCAALSRALQAAGLADETTFALLASLLGVAGADEALLSGLAADQRKRRTLDALIAWLSADAQAAPLVLLVEDLHWVDASTRDLLGTLLERIAQLPIMVVLTFRPEFVPAWAMHGQISTLPLARLTAEQCALVALGVSGGEVLPAHIADAVAQRTDGVPLFVEELTKAMLEAQAAGDHEAPVPNTVAGAAAPEVPATLRDSLTARLDRLGEAKLVAQVAAVLGREFDYGLLHAICGLPPAELEERLAALSRAEIIHQRGIPPRSHYVFKHALIQESAYDTLLKSTRAQYHRLAAEAYVQQFDEVAQAHPELVAHHFSRALMPAQAVDHWQRAGDVAVLRSGYSEAIGHLGAALEQLALLPESPERLKTELALRVKIGPAIQAMRGAASDAVDNYARAAVIAEALGDSPEGFMALWGDWVSKSVTSRILEAARRSVELVALAQRLGSDEYVLQAHHSRWTNYYVMGDARTSRADTLIGIRLYDREKHRHHRHIYAGHDPGTGANAAWLTGYADDARQLADQAIAIGKEIEHPFSQTFAFMWATLAACGTRDYALARERAEALLQIVDRHGFPIWRGVGLVVCGACRALAGESEFGLKLVGEGLVAHRQGGNASWLGFIVVTAATAHMQCGSLGRALELLTEGKVQAEKSHAKVLLPEIERLHAQALLLTGQIDAPQAILRIEAAAALARQQGAVMLEWRAALALAPLYSGAGRDAEARELLRTHYAAFTQGFATPDLLEGRKLLDGLS